jgi:hypothetical protein
MQGNLTQQETQTNSRPTEPSTPPLPLALQVYGKLNLTLYKMESECLATSLMSGDLDSAIDHCTASCTFLASVMPKYHPLTILQFVTLAELSVEGEMWEEAKMAYEIGKEGGRGGRF